MLKTNILFAHWKTLQEQHFHCEPEKEPKAKWWLHGLDLWISFNECFHIGYYQFGAGAPT